MIVQIFMDKTCLLFPMELVERAMTGGGELVEIITRGGRKLALTWEQASVKV